MKLEKLKSFENYISPIIHVIIKNKTEIIVNKIYPKDTPFKSILISENLPSDIDYTFQKTKIDINKPIIDFITKNSDKITDFELVIESEDILDISEKQENKLIKENNHYKILCPYEKPFRILSYNSQENNISLKKYPKETLIFLGLNNFALSNSSYCNTYNDLFLSNGDNNFLYKINNVKLNIEKLDIIPWKKKFHSMIYIPKKYIYFIGGNNRSTFYYDFINKIFKLWAPLKFKEKYPGLIYLNNTYIYSFGHQKKLDDLNFIERTNIKKKAKWDVINIKLNEPFNLKKFATVLSNDEKIYFVGGKKAKDDRIFYFDLTNNEISKTTQINTAMKIGESNFYKINEFTDVLIPQETKGDIKFIAFNQRTKKFRKLRYERDYDLINENEALELNENNPNLNEENIKINAEINLKKIKNNFEKEKTDFKEGVEEEFHMPNLLEIKKILLGDKNILNKNVEAMIFNRQRIKNKKYDKIDGDESENEYENINKLNDDEDENIFFQDEKSENISEEENEQENMKINLRSIPKQRDKSDVNDKNKNSYLRNIFDKDVDDDIDLLRVQNPRITIEDYKNLMFLNRISSSYIKNKSVNNNLINTTQNNSGLKSNENSFQFNNDNKLRFDLTGKNKKSMIFDKNPNIYLKNKIPKEEEKNNNNNKNISIGEKYINNSIYDSEDINKEKEKDKNKLSNNEDYIMNATIKGKPTSIIGEKNFGIIKANDTYNSITLRDMFGGDVNDKIILNYGTVVVPRSDSINDNNKGKPIKINEDKNNLIDKNIKPKIELNGINIKNLNPSIDINKIEVNKPNVINPEINVNLKNPKLSINKDSKIDKTLKEIFEEDVDDNINLNIINPILWSNDEKDILAHKLNANLNVDLNIEKPNIQTNLKKSNIEIEVGTNSDLGHDVISVYTEMKPISTLKEEFGKNIDDNINIKQIKTKLIPNEIYIPNYVPDNDIKIFGNFGIKEPDININIPNINMQGIKPNISITGNKPDLNKNNINLPDPNINKNINLNIPGIEIDLNNPKDNNEFIPLLTLKQIMNEDINSPYNLNIKKISLEPNEYELNLSNSYIDNKIPQINLKSGNAKIEINSSLPPKPNIEGITPIPIYESIKGEIPGKNVNKPGIEIYTGEIPGTGVKGKKVEISMKKQEINTDIKVNEPKVDLDLNKKGPKIDIQKPNLNMDIKGNKIDIDKDKENLNAITLHKMFSEDINDEINLNVINPELWGNARIIIPESTNDENKNININLPSGNINIVTPGISTPQAQFTLKSSDIPNFKNNINGEISASSPEINLKKPNLGIKIEKPNFEINKTNAKDSSITLKALFAQGINDKIDLLKIKPELWGNYIEDIYDETGLIKGKMNINIPSVNIDIKKPNVNMPNINLDTKINKPNLDVNANDINIPSMDINLQKAEINKDIKLKGSNANINLSKPKIDLNIKGPKFDLNKNSQEKNENSSFTLKDIFSQDVDENIKLKVINPKLWGNEENQSSKKFLFKSLNLKFPKRNVDMNDPNIDNILNYSLKASFNQPNFDTDINIGSEIPDINLKMPNIDLKGIKPKVDAKLKKANMNVNIKGIKFDINDKKGENENVTLKQLCNSDVNENINLNVINPELWGNDIPELNYNNSGIINGNLKLEIPKGNININGPNINIPNINISNNSKNNIKVPDFSMKGKIEGVEMKKPKIETDIKVPELNVDIKKPKININLIDSNLDKDGKNCITLKQIFNGDIEDNFKLNIPKQELWGLDNEDNISGLIDGNLDLKLPNVNLDIKGPKLNMPNISLKNEINKPKIETNLNKDINLDILNLEINGPNLNGNLSLSKPDINVKLNKPKINKDGMMSSVITLKQLFNEEVKNNIYLNVINPSLWGNIDNTASGTFELNTNFNLPSANINLTKPKFNLPDVNLGNINADINGKVYDDINMNIPKPNLDSNININGNIPGINMNIPKPNLDSNMNINGNIPGINMNVPKPNIDSDINIKGNIPDINVNVPKHNIDSEINIKGNIPGINMNVPKPNVDSNININGNIPGFNMNALNPNVDSNLNIEGNIPGINMNVQKPNIDSNLNIKRNIPGINVNIPKPNVDSNVNINGNIPGIKMNIPKPNIDSNININGNIPGFKLANNNLNNEFKPKITLKEEFGKDINENIINLNPKRHILSLDNEFTNLDNNINIPDININLPNFNIKGPKPNITDINLKTNIPELNQEINPPSLNNGSLNINLKHKNISRNPKKIVEESISGEIPGININKSRTELYTGKIPGIKKEGESSNTDKIKPEFNVDINGANLNGQKIGLGIDINGPNIKVDKEVPELKMDEFDINDIEFEPSVTLKNLFSGDINDEIDIFLKKKNQEFWGNKINNNLEEKKANIELKLPQADINIEKPNIFLPEVNISELDSEMKISDTNFNINKPKFNAEIKGIVPNLKINNFKKENSEFELELHNKEINLLSNNEGFNPHITLKQTFSQEIDDVINLNILKNKLSLKIPDDDNAHSSNIDSNINIKIKKPEINIPNIVLRGEKVNLNGKNNLEINNDLNIGIDIPKITSNIDINSPNLNNNEKIIFETNLPAKNKKKKLCMTLKDLFGQDVDENNFDDINIINPAFTRRNNTLYISGEKDKINYFPTDDISIKGPNIKPPSLEINVNPELNMPKINIEKNSEISGPNISLNKNKSSESEIVHNIPNNFDIKIKLPKAEINNAPQNLKNDINNNFNLEVSDFDRSNCDENIGGNIIPVNIDIKYKAITNSNDINNISPSKIKNKDSLTKFNELITLRELFNQDVNQKVYFTNTHIDYLKSQKIEEKEEDREEDKEEEKKEENLEQNEEDDFIFPEKEDIMSLNSISQRLNNNNNNMNNNENNDKVEQKKEKKEDDDDEYFDFDDVDLI